MENQFSGGACPPCPPCPPCPQTISYENGVCRRIWTTGLGDALKKSQTHDHCCLVKCKFPKTRGFDTFFDVWWCAGITHMTHHLLNQIYCFTPVIITGLVLEAKDWKPWIQYYPPTTVFCLHFSPSTKSKNRTYQMHLLKYCVSSFRYIYIYIYLDLSTFWPSIY